MGQIQETAQRLSQEVGKAIIGQEQTLEHLLVSLFSGGHVLLEDVPGVGKTALSKALSFAIGAPFKRIQCTPDLLPSDVVGTTVYNQKNGEFEFRQGPLFSQLVLVDEINRAIPRTQSALLEAMAEGQISVDGTTYPLHRPFFVMATQNPVESHGTFPLPEAQLDRFLMKISMGYPDMEEEGLILRLARKGGNPEETEAVVQPEEILAVQQQVREIQVSDVVERYLLEIVRKTRNHEEIRLGASPRGLIALGSAAQALAGIRGRDYVIPDDIKELAPVVLAHRLVLDPSLRLKQKSSLEVMEEILSEIPAPVEEEPFTSGETP
ncbi:MoxR family ATPase [Kroppenstedtia pulmonis]|uniref:MoxR family ATPase n=1 Tax=Kroppenstedtia pulmonis TaxID=1380685 RepID=A0A7D4BIV7_9BACL|nr:MoxR family ATPase [Kroppenstedtia pulmonis]QKG85775.1 MoxR family ATPase [Kroppenstedtia pulmonis]